MSVTIKEIATLCGVSRGTVDRVLNKRGNVNPETAKRIEDLANSLGYTPNKAATALAARKKNICIGILIISEGNMFFEDILTGIQNAIEELAPYGIQFIIKKMKGYNVETQLRLIDELIDSKIHGLIITPINDPSIATKFKMLHESNIPVITLNADIEDAPRLCYIGVDYYKSGQIAAGLLGLLHRAECTTGVITGSLKSLGHNLRLQGFSNIIAHQYPHIQLLAPLENNDDEIESFEVTKQLLINNPTIDALYLTAGGVYGACKAVHSLNLENKVTIICCDDIPQTKDLIAEGTIAATICQQPITQGHLSVKTLFDYLVHGTIPLKTNDLIKNEIKIAQNF